MESDNIFSFMWKMIPGLYITPRNSRKTCCKHSPQNNNNGYDFLAILH